MPDIKYIKSVLGKVLSIPSVTGDTDAAVDFIMKELQTLVPNWDITRLTKGAAIATLKGKSKKTIVLDAHLDTLGAMVKEIKSSGRLEIVPIGGLPMTSVECENCTIHTESGKNISGVLLSTSQSVHVYEDARSLERKPKNMEIRIDEEVHSREDAEKLGIAVGDFVSFDPKVEMTESGFVKSRFLDDKASVAILLGLIKEFAANKITPSHTIVFYFNTTEEVGAGAANGIDDNCVEFIAVDMGAIGDGQQSDEYTVSICAKDSSGPYSIDLRRELVAVAKKYEIPYKVDIYPFYGSDASAARRTRLDIRTIVIGAGIDASHSYERTHEKSLDAAASLLYYYLIDKQ